MEVNELNNLNVDNIYTKTLDVVNYNPSDELDVGENNYDYGESLYARKKRGTNIAKVVTTTLIIGSSGLLGGTLLFTMFKELEPVVTIISKDVSNVLTMKYNIENPSNDEIYFLIYEGEEEVYRLDSSTPGEYVFTVDTLKPNVSYNAKLAKYKSNTYTTLTGSEFTFTLSE